METYVANEVLVPDVFKVFAFVIEDLGRGSLSE